MKKIVLHVLILLAAFCVMAEDIQVNVALTSERNSFALKKDLEVQAKKAAIKKYIRKLNSQTPEKLIEEACNEYSNFVDSVKRISREKWTTIDQNHGQLSADYSVSLETDKINSWLKEKGFANQGGIEIIIMEEPPSLASMKVNEAFGAGLDGKKFFVQNYTTFQRRVRDAIVKKVGTFGFDVKLLEDNDQFAKFKNRDGGLVGVYWDVNKNDFSVDRDLMQAVKANNQDTLVLYYRIEALIFEADARRRLLRAVMRPRRLERYRRETLR